MRPVGLPDAGRDLALLSEVAQGLAFTLEPEEVFRRLLDILGRALDFEVAACAWMGSDISTGLLRLEAPADLVSLQREVEAAAREIGAAWSTRPVFAVERSLRYRDQERPLDAAPAFRLVAPLHRGSMVTGLLWLASPSPGLVREENRRLLLGMANQASLTLVRLEASQAAETHKFQAVIDSMPAGVFLLDSRGQARLLNPAARDLLSATGTPAGTSLRSLGGIDLMPLIAEAVRHGGPLPPREVEDGERVLRLSLTRVRGGGPAESPDMLLVAEDVTEQRRVQEQLMQSEKLSSLGEMISGVAHELNNPLATVMAYAQLLIEAEVPQDVRRMLGTVNSESIRCQKIVQSLLTFARRHSPERRRIELEPLLREAVQLVSYRSRSEGVKIDLQVSGGLPVVMADPHQLQQVFLNILNNACQAMEEVKGARRILAAARPEEGGVRIEFTDSGPGIAPEALPRLFDPFFTTKAVGEGTGLGLSLAYGIVREHGGAIEARNAPPMGACFSLFLPAPPLEARPEPPPARARDAAGARSTRATSTEHTVSQRILIVDDEEYLATVMREALEAEGYGVEVAGDGREALRRLGEGAFDLIITDVKMPNMSGRDLHGEILRRAPAMAGRVLFSTGDVINPATMRFFEETHSHYITKPFKLSDLRRVVRSLLGQPGARA
jgi:two-component system NtrC family sensor kinase